MRSKSKSKNSHKQITKPIVQNQQVSQLSALRLQLEQLRLDNLTTEKQILELTKKNKLKKATNATMGKTFIALRKQLSSLKGTTKQNWEQNNVQGQSSDREKQRIVAEILENYPCFMYQKRQLREICMVCLQQIENNENCRILPCSHFLHLQCANKSLRKEKVCPTCGLQVR